MHLKTLTLRGFKSFASATTLAFEPGVTCVVGPNGSGKSNVADALAWVMGEQGARSLRGGTMEDVVFAGTAARPPLGRAEVSLTIDNSDRALPLDFTEVALTRTMFRGGGSDYAINGAPARLLDVQELLSDSGIGREMHVVVGQGSLDAVLSAGPEGRRAFLEEAAGVLKHRKRKERALRKLEAMQGNLDRLQDLSAELRRQLAPLGRQAEVTRRAAGIQADLRDAKARLLADDLQQLQASYQNHAAAQDREEARAGELERVLADGRSREARAEEALRADAPTLAGVTDAEHRLSTLRERLRGLRELAVQRAGHLRGEAAASAPPARDPDALDREAADVRDREHTLAAALQADDDRLAQAVAARRAAQEALEALERHLAQAARAAADARESRAVLAGQVTAAEAGRAAREAEVDRLRAAAARARARARAAAQRFAAAEGGVADLDRGEERLDREHEQAAEALAAVERRLDRLRSEEGAAERERAAATARYDALAASLAPRDGAAVLLATDERPSGVRDGLARHLAVEAGFEAAVTAALGRVADAVVVDGLPAAGASVAMLRARDAGRATLLVRGVDRGAADGTPAGGMPLGPGEWPAADVVSATEVVRGVVHRLLQSVVVVPDLPAALALVARAGDLTAVTLAGDVVSADVVAGGSARAPGQLETQAAIREAGRRRDAAAHRGQQARFALAAAREEHARCRARVEAALAALYESDARQAAVAEELGQLGHQARAAQGEIDRLQRALAAAEVSLDRDREAVACAQARAAAVAPFHRQGQDLPGPDPGRRAALAAALEAARTAEVDARLALRSTQERSRAVSGRAAALAAAVAQERQARARAQVAARRRERHAARADAVAVGAGLALEQLDASLAAAAEARRQAEANRRERAAELSDVRASARAVTAELAALRESVHRGRVSSAELRLRVEALQVRAREDLGVEPDALVADYGPHRPVPQAIAAPPLTGGTAGEAPDGDVAPGGRPYVRDEQEHRRATAERALARLGRINPLALEEYAAVEERARFLTSQLEDLRATRRDLLELVREVDERVRAVFAAAFADTAREFEAVFPRLFPGGEGRLQLVDPDDLLHSGIEIEARPAGKRVKRLSLLSGGERALTALALLVAIFKARPSPFYVLDEVEAALDDTNLTRLLGLLAELRQSSQLLVITHQKRTMEIADALYGVSMRADGVSAVISTRLPVDSGAPPWTDRTGANRTDRQPSGR